MFHRCLLSVFKENSSQFNNKKKNSHCSLVLNRSFVTNYSKWSSNRKSILPHNVKFNKQVNIVISNQNFIQECAKRWMVDVDSLKTKMNELPEEERKRLIQKLEEDLLRMEQEGNKNEPTQYFKKKKMKWEDFRLFILFMLFILVIVPIIASLVYGVTIRRRPRVKGVVSDVDKDKGFFLYVYKIGDIEIEGRDNLTNDNPVAVGDKVVVYVHPQNFVISVVNTQIFPNILKDERGRVITELQLEPIKSEDGSTASFSLDSEAPPPIRGSRKAWSRNSEKEIKEKMEQKKQQQKERQERIKEFHRLKEKDQQDDSSQESSH